MGLLLAAAFCCSVSGTVQTPDGAPIAHARITIAAAHAETDVRGVFVVRADQGLAELTVQAPGFAAVNLPRFQVHEGARVDAVLDPLGTERLRTIGRVRIDGRLALERDPVPERFVSRERIDAVADTNAIDALGAIPSVTLVHTDGGVAAATTVAALRGPDPSETLVAFDGQTLNDSNTGDLDLARLPTSLLAGLDLSEGLGPRDATGANTIGGQIGFVALAPTRTPHAMLRASTGSCGASSLEANATGRLSRFGYAFAGGVSHEGGVVRGQPALVDLNGTNVPFALGATTVTRSALANLTWTWTPRADARLRVVTIDDVRDESAAQNAPADPGSDGAGALFVGSGPEIAAHALRAVLGSVRLPVGAGEITLRWAGSSVTRAILGTLSPGSQPYDFSLTNRLGTGSFEWSHDGDAGSFGAGASVRLESLSSPDQFLAPQRQRAASAFVRASRHFGRATLSGAAFDSHYSTFGTSLDGRLGLTYDLASDAVVRFGVGTGFRAPLLAELYALPLDQLQPDANCVGQNGNPAEHPEHATEYELGAGKRFANSTVDLSLYRTNLRDPIENYYPLGTTCPSAQSVAVAQSFPVNVGRVVYQGAALRLAHRAGPWFLRGEYGINAAYPTDLPAIYTANPTSGSNLVVGQQFLGIPIGVASFSAEYARAGTHGALRVVAKSRNNELAQGRFAVVDAAFGRAFAGGLDVTLAGKNITNAVSGRFTRLGLGTPYGTPLGPVPTDAKVLDPASVRLIVTVRR